MKKAMSTGLVLCSAVFFTMPVAAHDHPHSGSTHHHAGHHSAVSAADIEALPTSEMLRVDNCWIRLLPAPAPSAGYFVIDNTGSKSVKLVAADASAFDMVMLHQTTHDNGMSRMSMADNIDIPANGNLEFKPGGYHAMLEKPAGDVKVGSTISMNFQFDNNEKATARCAVKAPGTLSPQH